MPIAMKQATEPVSHDALARFTRLLERHPGIQERLFFSEQLSLLLETGTSLHTALSTLQHQTENPAMKKILQELSDQIEQGESLSKALRDQPELFNSTYVSLIEAAEGEGFLHQVLQRLTALDEQREKLRQQITSAALYPAFLSLFSVAVVFFVLLVVFPKFQVMFEAIRDQLPWTTRVLMDTSELIRHQWPWLLLGITLLFVAAYFWLNSDRGRQRRDYWCLHSPFISEIYIQLYLTESLRVLGLSLQHGVSVADALDATKDVVSNRQFQAFIHQAKVQVTEGKGLASGFEAPAWIPSLVKQMLKTGEDSGNLAKVMVRLAEHYDRELSKRLDTLTKLAEPVMLLVMGIIVGVLVSSLILPIFKLSQVVH